MSHIIPQAQSLRGHAGRAVRYAAKACLPLSRRRKEASSLGKVQDHRRRRRGVPRARRALRLFRVFGPGRVGRLARQRLRPGTAVCPRAVRLDAGARRCLPRGDHLRAARRIVAGRFAGVCAHRSRRDVRRRRGRRAALAAAAAFHVAARCRRDRRRGARPGPDRGGDRRPMGRPCREPRCVAHFPRLAGRKFRRHAPGRALRRVMGAVPAQALGRSDDVVIRRRSGGVCTLPDLPVRAVFGPSREPLAALFRGRAHLSAVRVFRPGRAAVGHPRRDAGGAGRRADRDRADRARPRPLHRSRRALRRHRAQRAGLRRRAGDDRSAGGHARGGPARWRRREHANGRLASRPRSARMG